MNEKEIIKIMQDNFFWLDANEGKGTKVKMVDKNKVGKILSEKFESLQSENARLRERNEILEKENSGNWITVAENAKLKEALGKANDTTIDKLLMEFQDAAQEGENFTLADIESILYDNYSQLKDNGTKKAD